MASTKFIGVYFVLAYFYLYLVGITIPYNTFT